MNDELSDDYFVRPEWIEPEEQIEAVDDQPEKPSLDRKHNLLRIVHDSAEPYTVRQDAKRLLELADCQPRDFNSRYAEFMAWRKYQKENQ